MRQTFQFKFYRSDRNRHLHRQIDIAAEIYNHCIALHRRYYRLFHKSLNKYRLQHHLTQLKKQSRFAHWQTLGSQAIQDITDRIERAYQRFFDNVRERQAGSTKRFIAPPSFKKRRKYKSFTLKQAGYRLLEGPHIKIGRRVFRYFKSRDISGAIKTVTIKRDPLGDLYLFFSCEVPEVATPTSTKGQNSAGFDFGLKTFLTSSEGTPTESPQFFKQGLNAIRKANRELSRKQRGSHHRQRARLNLARVHKRIANQRRDYHFKQAKKLAEAHSHLFFEDLNIEGMQRLWGRKVSDLGFSDFMRVLEHQSSKMNAVIHKIDRFFPSSKMCHVCRYIKHDLTLKDRFWQCPKCGSRHQRDVNAAINIQIEGATSIGLGSVRPPIQVAASA